MNLRLTQPVTKVLAVRGRSDASQFEGCQTARVETEQRGPLLPSPCQPPLSPFRSSDVNSPTALSIAVELLSQTESPRSFGRLVVSTSNDESRIEHRELSTVDTSVLVDSGHGEQPSLPWPLSGGLSSRRGLLNRRARSSSSDTDPTSRTTDIGGPSTNSGYGDAVRLSSG